MRSRTWRNRFATSLLRRPSPVEGDRCARHERRSLGGEEHHDALDLVQLTPVADRQLLHERGVLLGSFISWRFMSVANGPGQIAFTVTPAAAHSSASTRVRPTTPALEEA